MSSTTIAIIVLSFLVIILFLLWRRAWQRYHDLQFSKRSLSSRYGKMTEQFLPFLDEYPYLPENFRFIGNPIDGIAFEEDKIILIEFKTAGSRLTQGQQNIQDLVARKKVEFEEIRIE